MEKKKNTIGEGKSKKNFSIVGLRIGLAQEGEKTNKAAAETLINVTTEPDRPSVRMTSETACPQTTSRNHEPTLHGKGGHIGGDAFADKRPWASPRIVGSCQTGNSGQNHRLQGNRILRYFLCPVFRDIWLATPNDRNAPPAPAKNMRLLWFRIIAAAAQNHTRLGFGQLVRRKRVTECFWGSSRPCF